MSKYIYIYIYVYIYVQVLVCVIAGVPTKAWKVLVLSSRCICTLGAL